MIRIQASWFPLLYSFFIGAGMLICLGFAVNLHYSQVTRNHCRVWEFWPSVSAVIGDYSPEKNIWRVAIALGSGPRFVSGVLNFQMLQELLPDRSGILKIAFILDMLRIFAAGGWTYISSSEFLLVHEVCFVLYVVLSFLWVGLHTWLFYSAKVKPLKNSNSSVEQANSNNALFSFRWKLVCAIVQLVMFLISLYYFLIEHQQKCLPGAYSKYALCEWVLSAANILYDASCYLDFKSSYFTLAKEKVKSKSDD